MSARYVPQKVASSYYVMDTDAHCLLPDRYLSWSQALTAAGLLNTPEAKPAAPCCACAARVERHERFLAEAVPVLARNIFDADDRALLLRALGEMQVMTKGEGHATR